MATILVTLALWLAAVSGDGDGLSPREAAARERELIADLRSRYPDQRRRAVAGLAELGTREAWERVVRALEDPDAEVADEAQIRVAELDDRRLSQELLGRGGLLAGNDLLRLRVAEAFGRMPGPIDGEALARALRPRDVPAARAICWSLERLARRGALEGDRERIARVLEGALAPAKDPLLRAAALSALVAVEPSRAQASAGEAASDKEPLVRSAALAALAELDPYAARKAASPSAGDPSPAVRLAALRAIERHATRDGLSVLVERLDVEPRARVRLVLVEALQRLTGMLYRDDPRPWRLYVSNLPETWSPVETPPRPNGEPRSPQGGETRSAASLAGLPVLSDRVCFLVDFSGSLWHVRPDGRTRKSLADERIRDVLESLPKETEFNVVPYTAKPIPWRERLVPARRWSVHEAVKWFEDESARGSGNFFDAALFALSDPGVDTIVTLTDGAPTGGYRWNMSLMVDLLVEEARYSHVAFDTILVDARKGLWAEWERLARETGGRMLAVEF